MSDDVNENVEEVVQPTDTAQVQNDSREQKEPQKGSTEYNFREARRIMAEQSREIQELKNLVNSREDAREDKELDDLSKIGEDDFLTRRQAEALALRKTQELMAAQEQSQQEDNMRLRHKDYDDVVTEDNIKDLIEDDRDLANTIAKAENPYATAYKFIKKAAFYQDKTKKRNPDAEKILKNASKPVSSNAVQQRPLAVANDFARSSEEERRALWKETVEFASRRN